MDSISNPSVAIILINWNGFAFTKACLASLRKVSYPSFQVILVDNGSVELEGQKLKSEFPEIELLENKANLGFAGGNNVGIRKAMKAGFSHIMLLNNDTEVEHDFLTLMMSNFQSSPKLGVVQPLIFFLHQKEQLWSAGGKWDAFLGRAITLGDRKFLKEYSASDVNLDWATGCCFLVSREAVEAVGGLNEQYFAYFEDVDWSFRIREKGFGIALSTAAKIYHEAGASSKKKHSEGTLSADVFYWHVRNQFFLLRTHFSWMSILPALIYHSGRFLAWMAYFCLRGRFQKLKAVARGIKDGLFTTLDQAPKWP